MSDFHAWLTHPVTIGLGLLILAFCLLLCEILLRRLSDLGSVRFQGLVEDHEQLHFLLDSELANALAAIRWLQWILLALIWLVLETGLELRPLLSAAVLAAAMAVIVFSARFPLRFPGEDSVARILRGLRLLLRPLIAISRLGGPVPGDMLEDDEEEASDREIRAFLDMGEAAGIIEGEEGEILESLVEFFDTTVREVMTPRTEMLAISEDSSWDEMMDLFVRTLKSRIPVYRETIDHVVGIIHVKQLIRDIIQGNRPPVAELHQPCLVVPESKALGALLKDFQREQQQMAIVVDEYGGTAGLVTLEDILEEIVGEIQDELDPRQPPEIQELEPGIYLLQGRAPVEVLGELFDIEIDAEDIDTVGGLVFSRHGSVPEVGMQLASPEEHLLFKVEEMDGRRIVSVRVQAMEPNESSGDSS